MYPTAEIHCQHSYMPNNNVNNLRAHLDAANKNLEERDVGVVNLDNENIALKIKVEELESSLARMREALLLDMEIEKFDCPHDSEVFCKCSDIHAEMLKKYYALREEALQESSEEKG